MKSTNLKNDNAEMQKIICEHLKPSKQALIEKCISIPVGNYSEVGVMINDIIGVCRTALYFFSAENKLTENERESFYGVGVLGVHNVLEIAQKLIPHAEFDILDNLTNCENEND